MYNNLVLVDYVQTESFQATYRFEGKLNSFYFKRENQDIFIFRVRDKLVQ